MNTKFWILVILASMAVCSHPSEFHKEDGILVLTPDLFGKAYKKYHHLLVEYYAPWCGICKNFAPQYVQLVKILKRTVPGIELAKVDCDAHKEFCQSQGVESYPSIFYYDNGTERKYDERPNLEGMIKWFDALLHPIETIDSYARLHHRRKKNDHSIVLVAPHDSLYAELFKEFSIENPHFKWFHYCEPNSNQLSLNPPRILIKNSEVENITLNLDTLKDKEQIKHKIDVHRYPKLKMYEDPAITNMIFERNKPILLYIADTNQTYQKDKDLLQQVNEKTLEYAPVVIFIKDNVGKQAERFLSYFGVKTFPFILYMKQIKMGEMTKHYYRGKFSSSELLAFASDSVNGKLKEDYKSEPIPTKSDGVVETLVGANYRDVVTPENDLIITYYVQDCNICDEFVPTFNQVAEEYKKAGSKLRFARINTKENDCGLNLIGYPTIKLHKRGADRKVVDFSDKERTRHQLLTFLSREGFALPTPKSETQQPGNPTKVTTSEETQKAQAPKTETTSTAGKTTGSQDNKDSAKPSSTQSTTEKKEATTTGSTQKSTQDQPKQTQSGSEKPASPTGATSEKPKSAKAESK